MLIRRALISDAPAVTALYHDAYAENVRLGFPASAATVTREEVESWITGADLFVGLLHDVIVGAVRLKVYEEWGALVVGRLGVSGKWKGHGIGSALLTHAEQEAAAMGWKSLRLTTPIAHPYLPAMYRRRGYRDVGILELPDLPYDEVIMEKSLAD